MRPYLATWPPKISGLNTCLASSDWRAPELHEAVAVALDAFGPRRLVCGSDWPSRSCTATTSAFGARLCA